VVIRTSLLECSCYCRGTVNNKYLRTDDSLTVVLVYFQRSSLALNALRSTPMPECMLVPLVSKVWQDRLAVAAVLSSGRKIHQTIK